MYKKCISILLTMVMVAGVIFCVPYTFGAETNDSDSEGSISVIDFGHYFQTYVTDENELELLSDADFDDNKTATVNGIRYYKADRNTYYRADPITWRIISQDNGGYLLISDKVLAVRDFHGWEAFWSQCDLRNWLNSSFFDEAFTQEEQENIVLSEYTNTESDYDNNPNGGKPYTVELQDYVYLLDKDEIAAIYPTAEERVAYATDYANDGKATRYWLRGPKKWNYGITQAYYVDSDGSIGSWYPTYSYGVRPVIKVEELDPTFDTHDTLERGMYKDAKKIQGIDVKFNKNWFFDDSGKYNHNISKLCAQMSLEGYQTETDLAMTLKSLGFDVDMKYIDLDTGRDEMNYFIVSKPIKKNDKSYKLVFVGCIGSHHKQWNSDFDPDNKESKANYGDTEVLRRVNHLGFNDAKNFIYNKLYDYVSKKMIDKSETKLLLTGHSRGAATANLLAAKLIDADDIASPSNMYTYTFATPNCTTNVKKQDSKYDRIFNIVNPCDFVTKVLLPDWGYGRYGTTFSLPAKTNDITYLYLKNIKFKKYYDILNNATTGNTIYNDYKYGEADVFCVTEVFSSCVKNLDDYYHTDYALTFSKKKKPFEYFQEGLCPIVNGSGDDVDAILTMLSAIPSQSVLYKTLSLFFLGKEGISGFNTGVKSKILFEEKNVDWEKNLLKNLKGSGLFADAHKMETYCAYMMGLSSDEVTARRWGFLGSVNCPVDVEIIDKETGEVVGRIVNNTVDEEILAKDNAVVMTVNGDEKQFWLPSNGDFDVRLIGNDDGVMDYTISEVDPDIGETARMNYYDVDIEKDKEFVCTAGDVEEEDASLADFTLTDENGEEVEADEVYSDEDMETYTVETEVEGSGTATEAVTVCSGDYVTLTAIPDRSEFIGWYQGDTLVSDEPEYRFRPTEDVTCTAAFTEATYVLGDVDADDQITVADAANIQREQAGIDLWFLFVDSVSDADRDGEVTLMDATYLQSWLADIVEDNKIGKPIE